MPDPGVEGTRDTAHRRCPTEDPLAPPRQPAPGALARGKHRAKGPGICLVVAVRRLCAHRVSAALAELGPLSGKSLRDCRRSASAVFPRLAAGACPAGAPWGLPGDGFDGSGDALLGGDLDLDVRQLALFVDHEVATDVALLFAPDAVRLGDLVAGVDQQREGQVVFGFEGLVRGLIVGADAEDGRIVGLEARVVVAQTARLARSTRGVVPGIEIQHHAFAAMVAEFDVRALV